MSEGPGISILHREFAALTAASIGPGAESAEAANHDFVKSPPPSPEVQASNVSVQQRVAFWKSGSRV
jgi:hypothetical protein